MPIEHLTPPGFELRGVLRERRPPSREFARADLNALIARMNLRYAEFRPLKLAA